MKESDKTVQTTPRDIIEDYVTRNAWVEGMFELAVGDSDILSDMILRPDIEHKHAFVYGRKDYILKTVKAYHAS